ncbi:MAG: hypothetical protein U0Y82_10365 [Thermoleophilia bacterium]
MMDLAHSPLRLVAFVIAAVGILPASVLIFRHMRTLRDRSATMTAQGLDLVWTAVPLVALAALLVLTGME